jgi:hypothetical protein
MTKFQKAPCDISLNETGSELFWREAEETSSLNTQQKVERDVLEQFLLGPFNVSEDHIVAACKGI